MRRLGTTLTVAAALMLLPGSAFAAVAEVVPAGGTKVLRLTDRDGETNELEVVWRWSTHEFELRDASALLEPGDGCRSLGDQAVGCRGGGVRRIEIEGGDGDDRLRNRVPPVPGSNVYYVDLRGGEGDDHIQGSNIDEGFDGGPGADYVSGGRGTDTVTQSQTDSLGGGVIVTMDARPNDGLPGEGDNIRNMEHIVGSPGDDTIVDNRGAHHLYGGAGSDLIQGKGGPDAIDGGDGVDQLEGGAGIDHINALDPGRGDGRDRILCGSGWDDGAGDPQDGFALDCEQYRAGGIRFRNPPTSASGRPPGLPAIVSPTVIVRRTRLIVFAGCRQTAGCSGTVKVAAAVRSRSGAIRRPTLARGRFTASAGQLKMLRLRVSKRRRKYLRRARRGTATVVAKGEFGGERVTRRRVRLR